MIAIGIAVWCWSTVVVLGKLRDISELDFWSASLVILAAGFVIIQAFAFIKWFRRRWNEKDEVVDGAENVND